MKKKTKQPMLKSVTEADLKVYDFPSSLSPGSEDLSDASSTFFTFGTDSETKEEKKSRKKRKVSPANPQKKRGKASKVYKTKIASWLHHTEGDGGYSVTEAHWYPVEQITRGAPPLSEEEFKNYVKISAEEACKLKGITLTRQLEVDLSPQALKAVQKAMTLKLGEYDSLVLALCESGEVNKCCIVRKPSQEISLISTDTILEGEPIGVFTGVLQARPPTAATSSNEEVIAHLWDFDLSRGELPKEYEGPDLVVQTKLKGNETRFLNDANPNDLELGPEVERAPNVHPRLAWNRKKQLPYIVFVAVCPIPPNSELFLDWGKTCRRELNQFQLETLAHKSHAMHRWASTLQNLLLKHNLPLVYLDAEKDEQNKRAAILKEGAGYSLLSQESSPENGAEVNKKDEADEVTDDEDATEKVNDFCQPLYMTYDENGQEVHFQDVNPVEAYVNSNCQLIRESKLEILEETREKLKEACAANTLDYTELVKKVIKEGNTPYCSIKEIVSLHHPARLYTRPDKPAYALLATKNIRMKQAIGVYNGIYRETQRFHQNGTAWWQQVYAYDVLQQQIGDDYDGPDLVVESLVCGNECRFINDAYGRAEGLKAVNAVATIVWDKKRCIPAVVLTASKSIPKDTEVVVDYGEEFWRKVVPILLSEHRVFLEKAGELCEKMKNILLEHDIAIPPEPSQNLQNINVFNPAGVDYYPRTSGTTRVYSETWTPIFNGYRCTTVKPQEPETIEEEEEVKSSSDLTLLSTDIKTKHKKRKDHEPSSGLRATKRLSRSPMRYNPPYGRRIKKLASKKLSDQKDQTTTSTTQPKENGHQENGLSIRRKKKTLSKLAFEAEDVKSFSTQTLKTKCGKMLRAQINLGLGSCEFLDPVSKIIYAPCPIGKDRNSRIYDIQRKVHVSDTAIKELLTNYPAFKNSFRERRGLSEHVLYSRNELYDAIGDIQVKNITSRDVGAR